MGLVLEHLEDQPPLPWEWKVQVIPCAGPCHLWSEQCCEAVWELTVDSLPCTLVMDRDLWSFPYCSWGGQETQKAEKIRQRAANSTDWHDQWVISFQRAAVPEVEHGIATPVKLPSFRSPGRSLSGWLDVPGTINKWMIFDRMTIICPTCLSRVVCKILEAMRIQPWESVIAGLLKVRL